MKRKVIIGIVAVLVIVVAIIANNKPEENTNGKPVVKIGLNMPISGNLASISDSLTTAIELAYVNVKEEKGELKYNYEFIKEDNAMENKKAYAITKKMQQLDKVDIIYTVVSDKANVINSALENSDILLVAFASDPNISKRGLSVQFAPHPSMSAELMARELKKRDIDNVNIFLEQNNFFTSKEAPLIESLLQLDIKYNFFKFNPGEKDFRMMIANSKKSEGQINILLSYSPTIEVLARQLKEMGSEVPITSLEAFAYAENKDVFSGYWFITPVITEDNEFLGKFEKKLGTPNTESSEYTYEFFKWLINSCEETSFKNGKLDTYLIRDKISSSPALNFDTGDWEVDENGYMRIPSMVGVIKNGKVERLEE